MKTKCLIVDDEDLALNILEAYIRRIDDLELVGRANNAVEALNILRKTHVDVLFLDIQMPQISGIDFLKTLPSPPKVIITSAFSSYAIEGYDLNVTSFLLKPVSFDKFLKAINKVQQLIAQPAQQNQPSVPASNSNETYIYVKEDKLMSKVFLKDILFVEGSGNYVKIKTTTREITTYCSISAIEEKLTLPMFLRIHKSFIVAVDKITSFSASLVFIGNTQIPIGRVFKNEVLKVLGGDWLG